LKMGALMHQAPDARVRARKVQVYLLYWLKRGVALPAIQADVINPPAPAPLALPAPAQA